MCGDVRYSRQLATTVTCPAVIVGPPIASCIAAASTGEAVSVMVASVHADQAVCGVVEIGSCGALQHVILEDRSLLAFRVVLKTNLQTKENELPIYCTCVPKTSTTCIYQ